MAELSNQLLKISRNQNPFTLTELADQFVAFTIKSHGATEYIPERVIARMGMQVVFAAPGP